MAFVRSSLRIDGSAILADFKIQDGKIGRCERRHFANDCTYLYMRTTGDTYSHHAREKRTSLESKGRAKMRRRGGMRSYVSPVEEVKQRTEKVG